MIKLTYCIIKARLGGDLCQADVITHKGNLNLMIGHFCAVELIYYNWEMLVFLANGDRLC